MEKDVGQFLIDLFSVADRLNVKADETRGFSIASNELRIHWLLNNLLRDRFTLSTRNAAPAASVEWLVSLSDRVRRKKNEGQTADDRSDDKMIDDDTAAWLYDLSIMRLRAASEDGILERHSGIIGLLFRWKDRVGDQEVRSWTDKKLASNDFVCRLARDAIRETWSHGMGGFGSMSDRVAQKSEYVYLQPLSPLLDVCRFRERVISILELNDLEAETRDMLEHFQKTPERDPSV